MKGFTFYDPSEKVIADSPKVSRAELVAIQTAQLQKVYGTDCLDVTQLKTVLNVGDNNVYLWLKKCPEVRTINRRKVVPVIWVADYLVNGGNIHE